MQIQSDQLTAQTLNHLSSEQEIRQQKVPGVRSVLVVLSSRAMTFDVHSLRHKICETYPEATVFFQSTMGSPFGAGTSNGVDLLIDFTGPGQKQGIFYARKLRKIARFAAGRNAGFFRKKIYDRIFDEKLISAQLSADLLERERFVQGKVLELVGVAVN